MNSLYLESLSLRNFATFENQTIKFNSSFNGIVGETGSGKSLILDAFHFILGSRADKKLVRKGAKFATIEGTFKLQNANMNSFFDDLGFPVEDDQSVVIKRIIYAGGKSKSFLNHLSCSLATLNKFSKTFVDLVGQFENQKLTQSDYQLYLLDQFSENENLLSDYKNLYQEYLEHIEEITKLEQLLSDRAAREDYLRFQMQELENLNPTLEKERELIQKKSLMLNLEENAKDLSLLKGFISEGETSIELILGQAAKIIDNNPNVVTNKLSTEFNHLKSLCEDFSYELSRSQIDNETNESLDEVLEDLDKYQKLKRKFNVTSDELSQLHQQFKLELSEFEQYARDLKERKLKADQFENKLYEIASQLHKKRESGSLKMQDKVTKALRELNMRGSTFKINTNKLNSLGPKGISNVFFSAETNPGEGFYRIKDIASGGELSRILLSVRQIVASEDTINIFFFDEIDTGIGGETAHKIARALKNVSKKGQVLAITHLAQIAKEVDEIIYVDKKSLNVDENIRTVSFVSIKKGSERTKIINQLAGL